MAATIASGSQNQYSTAVSGGTTPSDLFIRDVPDWTEKLTRTDVPFSKMIGSEGAPSMPMNKAEWGWGSVDPYATTITEAQASTSDPSFTFASGTYLQIGDRVLIDSEEVYVTAVNGNVATVTRGFAGTTAATHLDNAVAYILGPAVVESADDADSPFTQGEVDYNYHQIMSFTWSMSKRREVTPTYERRNAGHFSAEQRKKMEFTAPTRLELTWLLGQRALGTGSSPSAMGGLRQSSYITTRTSLSSAILTETDLMNMLQTIDGLVGPSMSGKTIMCSSFGARIISSWYNESRRSDMSTSKAKVNFTEIETDFGTVKVVRNHLMNTIANDKMYLANFDDFKKRPYATGTGWQTGEYQTQGWHKRGFLRGDFTLLAELADTRGELHTFSTTAGSYSGLA
jgi:hypothetical protein